MKTVTSDAEVYTKLYLETSPSSSLRSPLKNYFAKRAAMNRNSTVRTPRLPMADKDLSTV